MSTVTQGTLVGGFRIREALGTGAMGEVYLAEAVESGDPIAVRSSLPGRATMRASASASSASARSRQASATHVVTTIASGETEGHLYLAMEYVEGSDLREILRREAPLEPCRAVRLIAQVADALDAAHELGLVHRDIKPGNILVTERGGEEDALVCDFGLARHVSSVSSLTGDRGFVGTIDYVPPEQIQDARSTGVPTCTRSAASFSSALSERGLSNGRASSPSCSHISTCAAASPDGFRAELPAAWDDFFAKALAKEPNERFGSGRSSSRPRATQPPESVGEAATFAGG